MVTKMKLFFPARLVQLMLLSAIISPHIVAAQQWTLQDSISQAISMSPELEQASAEIGARQQDINMSGFWPDPEIAVRVDNKMGQDDGAGGYDLTDITVSQDIPMSRIKHQQSVAQASLKAARYQYQYQTLQVQHRVSKVFHHLQFASAKLALAEKQLKLASKLSGKEKNSGRQSVVRYLTPLEEMRLAIIREEAQQAVANAEGKYKEALSEFIKLLGIEMDSVSGVSELQAVVEVPDLSQLMDIQNEHVQLASQLQEVMAANHQIDVARDNQSIDPTIGLSWSRDTLSVGRSDIYAIMFNIQIPISDRVNTAESKATYKASQQKIELQLIRRELKINLNRSHTHLNHVIEQAVEYRAKVLKPAAKILELTEKGFASGELNILSLVDANNTYFESQLTYLDLLHQARLELADVMFYAGRLISGVPVQDVSLNQGGI